MGTLLRAPLFVVLLAPAAISQNEIPGSESRDFRVSYGPSRDGQYPLSFEEFRRFLETHSSSGLRSDAPYLRAECQMNMGKLGAVLKRSEALAETYTRNRPVAIALFRLGEADHSLRGNDGAVNRFCEIPDNKPDVDLEGVAAYWIGESFYRNREYERALRYYKISHGRRPKDYESNSAQLPVIRMPEESMGYPRANVTNDVLGPKNVVWHGYAHLPRSASLTVGYT